MGDNAATMKVQDTLQASSAECYLTIGTRRYNFMSAFQLEAKAKKNKTKIPILGRNTKGNKSGTIEITGTMKVHYNQSVIRQMMTDYKDTGEDIYFDIEVTNKGNATLGNQTVCLIDCNADEITLAKFDANAEYLDEDISFTAEDWQLPEKFNELEGM